MGVKNFSATYNALGDYEVKKLYVEKESLAERGLTQDDLINVVYEDEDDDYAEKPALFVVSKEEMSDIMAEQDVVLSF
jgi:tRNA 2-thiouridine synthesizing protein C